MFVCVSVGTLTYRAVHADMHARSFQDETNQSIKFETPKILISKKIGHQNVVPAFKFISVYHMTLDSQT